MIGNLPSGQVGYRVRRGVKKTDLGSAIPRNKRHSSLFLVRIEDWGTVYVRG